MKQLKNLVLFTAIMSFQISGIAQSFSIEIASDSILLGNTVELRFTMENVDGKFEAPEFESMEIITGPNVTSSFSSINGESTSSKTYNYIIRPLEEGEFIIDPVLLVSDGEEYYTELQAIYVYPNEENVKQNNTFENSNSFFFSFPFDVPNLNKKKTTKKKPSKYKLKKI